MRTERRWRRSEALALDRRFTARREGEAAWVTPAFEKARALEQIQIGSDVRAWEEDESPYALLASVLRDGKATRRVGVDETLAFVFVEGLATALPAARLVSATAVTAGCRMIKDAHELAIMRRANEITVHAHRAVFATLREGRRRRPRRCLRRPTAAWESPVARWCCLGRMPLFRTAPPGPSRSSGAT